MLDRAQESVRRYASLVAASSAALLIVLHLFWPNRFRVDAVTVALVAVILALPYLHLIRHIKIFDFEADIEREDVQRVADTVSRVQKKAVTENEGPVKAAYADIYELATVSPPAAFAQLRLRLQHSLLRMLESFDPARNFRTPPSSLTVARDLLALGAIEEIDAEALREVTAVANRAIHGAEIDPDDAREAIENGISLLRYFESLGWQKPDSEEMISNEKEHQLAAGLFKATTVVPLGGALGRSKKRTYTVTQAQLESLYERFLEWPEYMIGLDAIREDPATPTEPTARR
jgi:hypothetical protein